MSNTIRSASACARLCESHTVTDTTRVTLLSTCSSWAPKEQSRPLGSRLGLLSFAAPGRFQILVGATQHWVLQHGGQVQVGPRHVCTGRLACAVQPGCTMCSHLSKRVLNGHQERDKMEPYKQPLWLPGLDIMCPGP